MEERKILESFLFPPYQLLVKPWQLYVLSDEFSCPGLPSATSLPALIADRRACGFLVSAPRVSLLNAAAKEWSPVRQVPLRALPAAITCEHLPWRLAATGLACRHLRSGCAVLAPMDTTCTIAVTAKFQSPLSEALQSLAWCLHLDMTPFQLHWTHPQLVEAVRLGAAVSQSASAGATFWTDFLAALAAPRNPPPASAAPAAPGVTASRRSGAQKTASCSDERSVSSSGVPAAGVLSAARRGPKLSLWLQWTLARGSAAFAVGGSAGERVTLDLGECSLSLDVQEHFSQVN